jgi:signal-transduction protein with cAMP-binding, CBS, and nucleotidyltransferase domain
VLATKKINFFKDLGEDLHKECLKAMTICTYHRDDVICTYGEEGTSFCVILKGMVSVHAPMRNNTDGEE